MQSVSSIYYTRRGLLESYPTWPVRLWLVSTQVADSVHQWSATGRRWTVQMIALTLGVVPAQTETHQSRACSSRANSHSELSPNGWYGRALRRRHSFGGGAPGDFDRRRRHADRFFSAAAASIKCRRRGSQEWRAWVIFLPFLSHHAVIKW